MLIMSFNRALQRELDSFFTKLSNSEFTIREATKGAFTQARAKMNDWGFARLNQVVCDSFYESCDHLTWKNHRLTAVDGSTLLLPNHESVREEFGVCNFGPNTDSVRSMATASMLYDVLNQVTLDARLAPFKNKNGKASGERALLEEHINSMEKDDLLLLDRGYPSFLIFFLLAANGVHFCARMKTGWWKEVRNFVESGEKERIVHFTLPKSQRAKLKGFPTWSDKKLACRLLRIQLDTGEIEVLCTSLTDMETYPHSEFKELYHLRWNEEEAYKLLKTRIELEDFSGKTANAVKQDFQAKILLLTLTAVYAHPVEERVKAEFRAEGNRKHAQKINRTNAISMTKDILIGILINKKIDLALQAFDKVVYSTREIIRPDRKFERKKIQKKPYSMNIKRL